jgi:uncharacterized protein YggE
MKKNLFILIILLSNLAIAQNNTLTTIIQPTIDVMGVGIVKVTPDEVTIKVQVEHKGQNPKELKQKNRGQFEKRSSKVNSDRMRKDLLEPGRRLVLIVCDGYFSKHPRGKKYFGK